MRAKYWMTFFVFSVLPAPDSPLYIDRESLVEVEIVTVCVSSSECSSMRYEECGEL